MENTYGQCLFKCAICEKMIAINKDVFINKFKANLINLKTIKCCNNPLILHLTTHDFIGIKK